jgi:3'(2'), 5'-bisphosphate nucleotidase
MEPLIELAREAGRLILDHYGRDVRTTIKADDSPVTAADLAAHELLMRKLPKLIPSTVVSEESEGAPADVMAVIAKSASCWVVDPLDGTRDFLGKTGDFTVNVAFMESGRPVLGCVYSPVRRICYTAVAGHGAFRTGPRGEPSLIRSRAVDPQCGVCLVSRFHAAGEVDRLRRAWPGVALLPVGSALKYGIIAEGSADLAVRFTPTSPWDTAAAQIVLEESGGALVTFDGAPLTYDRATLPNPPFVAVGDRGFDVGALIERLGPLPARP